MGNALSYVPVEVRDLVTDFDGDLEGAVAHLRELADGADLMGDRRRAKFLRSRASWAERQYWHTVAWLAEEQGVRRPWREWRARKREEAPWWEGRW